MAFSTSSNHQLLILSARFLVILPRLCVRDHLFFQRLVTFSPTTLLASEAEIETYNPGCYEQPGSYLGCSVAEAQVISKLILPPSVPAVHPDRGFACLMRVGLLSGNAPARLRDAAMFSSSAPLVSGGKF